MLNENQYFFENRWKVFIVILYSCLTFDSGRFFVTCLMFPNKEVAAQIRQWDVLNSFYSSVLHFYTPRGMQMEHLAEINYLSYW